jgi:hypothetical protein
MFKPTVIEGGIALIDAANKRAAERARERAAFQKAMAEEQDRAASNDPVARPQFGKKAPSAVDQPAIDRKAFGLLDRLPTDEIKALARKRITDGEITAPALLGGIITIIGAELSNAEFNGGILCSYAARAGHAITKDDMREAAELLARLPSRSGSPR